MGFKSEVKFDGDLYTRCFDTEKRPSIKVSLTPGRWGSIDMKPNAWSRETFVFDHWPLQPRKYEFNVTGRINFKYLDKEGNVYGSEELDVTLSFWLEGVEEADSKPPPPTANSVVPNSEADKSEKEST